MKPRLMMVPPVVRVREMISPRVWGALRWMALPLSTWEPVGVTMTELKVATAPSPLRSMRG